MREKRPGEYPKEAKIIDAKGKTIIPGLIDAHLHFTYPPKEEEFFFINEAISAFRAAAFLRKMLFIGVTTVRDVASFQKVGYEARKAFNSGILEGSRPIVTGPGITSTGGHGREGYRLGIVEEADGTDGFRRAVRARIKQGADLIKVLPPYSREEILAAVEEAHFHEKFITVHSGVYKVQYDFVRWVVEAGADCIEHAYALPEDVIPQIAAKKIYCIPTLSILIKLGKQYAV
ncbi:MAG: amidohydrolase family protein [Candidatus Aminicenantales bacterium]